MRDLADLSMLKGISTSLRVLLLLALACAYSTTAYSQEVENCASSNLVSFQGDVYYCANHPDFGEELFKSDGGRDTTSLVFDVEPGANGSRPSDVFEFNGTLFFVAANAADGRALWSSDGTPEGTQLLKTMDSDEAAVLDAVVVQSSEAFYQIDGELWRTDGSADGTFVMNAEVVAFDSDSTQVTPNTSYHYSGDTLFYVTESRLFRISSSSNSEQLIAELPDNDSTAAIATELSQGRDIVIFADGLDGTQVWQSDGTSDGTELVQSDFRVIGTLDGKILACSPENSDLVLLDGDTTSVLSIADQGAGNACSDAVITSENNVAGRLIFAYAGQLWSSDLTESGTGVISPDDLSDFALLDSKVVNGRFVFRALESGLNSSRFGLFGTDGTLRGTRLIKREEIANTSGVPRFEVVGATENQVFFTIRRNNGPIELWQTDGGSIDTVLVTEVPQTINRNSWSNGQRLYFNFNSDNEQLWHSDGTANGTYGLMFGEIVAPPIEPPVPDRFKANPAIYLLLLDDD